MRETIGLSDTGSRPQSIELSDIGLKKLSVAHLCKSYSREKAWPSVRRSTLMGLVLSELQSASAPVHRGRLLVVG
jgi:hypothetical protein